MDENEKPENPGTVAIDDSLTLVMKGWKYFKKEDTFNPGVVVEGWLNPKPTFYYGSLYIVSVNGVECEQFIPCTPKMHYPYKMDGEFHWPEDISSIDVFEKVDGSNIFQFIYKDDKGEDVVSYKTRLMPFVDPGSKYSMYGLWAECLEKYPKISTMPYEVEHLMDVNGYDHSGPIGISYEMYGRKNLIMVRYKELIDCKVLFYRELSGERKIFPPSFDIGSMGITGSGNAPQNVELVTTIAPESNLEEEYWKVKEWLDGKISIRCMKCNAVKVLKKKNYAEGEGIPEEKYIKENLFCPKCGDEGEDLVEGLEGCMLYANGRHGYAQFKVKPQYVLDIHHKGAEGIPAHAIMITIKNAFEESDDVTVEHIVELLKEEFQLDNILRKLQTIDKLLKNVRADRIIRNKLLPVYDIEKDKDNDFDINFNKGKVMRFFATRFEQFGLTKRDSTKVFKVLWDYYGVE